LAGLSKFTITHELVPPLPVLDLLVLNSQGSLSFLASCSKCNLVTLQQSHLVHARMHRKYATNAVQGLISHMQHYAFTVWTKNSASKYLVLLV